MTNGQYTIWDSVTISCNTTDKWSVNYEPRTSQHTVESPNGQYIVRNSVTM